MKNQPFLRFQTSTADGSIVKFSCNVIGFTYPGRNPIIRVSERVRYLPFPPWDGKRTVILKPEMAAKIQYRDAVL